MNENMNETKNNTIFHNLKFQNTIRILTAFSFLLFAAYQTFLSFMIDVNRVGRLIGVAIYFLISLASFLVFSDTYAVRTLRSILLVSGFLGLVVTRLFNAPIIIDFLNTGGTPGKMYFAVFLMSQLATIMLTIGYLILKTNRKPNATRTPVTVMMVIVIILFIVFLILEVVLILKYHMLIDLGVRLTLLGRVLFCGGFAGTALGLILPAPKIEEKPRMGHYVYSDSNKDEIDLVL